MPPIVTDSPSSSTPPNIGRFRIDAVLGRGGMGEVYKAFDPTLQRTVAVKIVRPDISRPDLLARLLREAQACARLRHPNVVTVYEAGEIGDVVYVVMEYLHGDDVGALLRHGSLAFEDKIRILVQVLDGLHHAHGEGVIHRDIKPSNVHREPGGGVKVVDFGLARMSHAPPLTRSDAALCTLDYASPEQLRGEPLDKRTDVYSTGALAYELFTGRPPFRADNESVGALVLRVVSEPAPPMDDSWTRLFPEVERIVARAMAKSPADRFQSAEEMRNAITSFVAASREAILAAQAELDRAAPQSVIDATALTVAGRPGDAETHLPEALRVTPDAGPSSRTLPARRGGPADPGGHALPETRTAANAGADGHSAVVVPATRAAGDDGLGQPSAHVSLAASAPSPATAPSSRRWWWQGGAAAAVVVTAVIFVVARTGGLPQVSPAAAPDPLAGHTQTPRAPAPPVEQTQTPATPGTIQSPAAAAPLTSAPRSDTGAPASPVASVPAQNALPGPAARVGEPAGSDAAVSGRDVSAKQLFAAQPDSPAGAVNAGLRFQLTRRSADGVEADVDPSTTSFRSGDRIRFTFESNIDGFLYVVQQGSSGRWTVLFPGPGINLGRNAVGRSERYDVPFEDWFRFDDTPGTEQVFVFLSRQPLLQLPGFDRPVTQTESVVASVVEELQQRIAPRDLVFEKDARKRTGTGAAVQATYVVNRAKLGQSVAASISLIHTR